MAPERPIGFWLKLVDRLITDQFDAAMEEHGVTRRQWQILNLLAEAPVTVPELRAALPGLSAEEEETVAENLDELADSGWVASGGERRQLTELGRSSLERLTEVVERTRELLTQDVSAEEYQSTLDVLRRMAGNLGWQE